MYKKMVVLLDGSELAEVVFDYAQEVSGRMHVDMDLLHVCSPDQEAQLPMNHRAWQFTTTKMAIFCLHVSSLRMELGGMHDPLET